MLNTTLHSDGTAQVFFEDELVYTLATPLEANMANAVVGQTELVLSLYLVDGDSGRFEDGQPVLTIYGSNAFPVLMRYVDHLMSLILSNFPYTLVIWSRPHGVPQRTRWEKEMCLPSTLVTSVARWFGPCITRADVDGVLKSLEDGSFFT